MYCRGYNNEKEREVLHKDDQPLPLTQTDEPTAARRNVKKDV